MARKTISGLYQRNGTWHIDKVFRGQRIQESTGSSDRKEAEQYLIHKLEKLREQKIYGVRTIRTWREAATRYLIEYKDQPSIGLTAIYLEQLDPYIGDQPLTHVDDETLAPYIRDRLKGTNQRWQVEAWRLTPHGEHRPGTRHTHLESMRPKMA
jgi:hypothetical protein